MSASAGGKLRLWDLDNRQLLRTLEEHVEPANAITVTADGRHAVCTSSDHMLRVWDVETGIGITAFTGESPMSRCTIVPDGQTIVAREKSGRGHLLRLEGLN
jgi:WD40 repeat protein